MKVLALDLSLTSTGWARQGQAGAIPTKDKRDCERLDYISKCVRLLLARRPDVVTIEGPAYGARGRGRHESAGLWWVIKYQAWRAGLRVAVVDPMTLKVYATNNGNADKKQMTAVMRELHPGVELPGDDEADAYALLSMTHQKYRVPMSCCGGHPGELLTHERAADAISKGQWPKGDQHGGLRAA